MGKKGGKKKKIKVPDFCFGYSHFQFANDDSYAGGYCAHKSGVLWRYGLGTYRTADGHTYHGQWKEDKLAEDKECKITFPNGHQFHGTIVKGKFQGPGQYRFENGAVLLCHFDGNKPKIGSNVIVIDENRHFWHGIADDTWTVLRPEHIFSKNLLPHLGKGEAHPIERLDFDNMTENDVREIVFRKSHKIPSNRSSFSSLSLKSFQKGKHDPKPITNLLETFFSDEYKNSCPAERVFYPQTDAIQSTTSNMESCQNGENAHL